MEVAHSLPYPIGNAATHEYADACLPRRPHPWAGGANNGSITVGIKSVCTTDSVCFLTIWADPTESWLRAP